MLLWLKQHFGIFFDFQFFGNLNWLAVPLLIYFAATIKKRKRWERALAFVYIISCLFLALFGRSWSRYILTLYPITLAFIFMMIWEFIKKKNRGLQISVFLLCGAVVFFNLYHFRKNYKTLWDYKVSSKIDPFPHDLLNFINNISDLGPDSSILVCAHSFSLHSFYYHTNKRGIAYPDPRLDIYYYQRRDEKEDLDILQNQLKIKYVYLDSRFIESDWRFGLLVHVISKFYELVYQEKGGYLYRLQDKEPESKDLEKLFVNDSLLKNGSFERWSQGPLKTPDYFEGGGQVFIEDKQVKAGQYAAKIIGDNFNFTQKLANFEDYKGKSLTCFVWMKTAVRHKYRIQIYDGINSSFSDRHWGRGGWQLLQANHLVNPSAEFLAIRVVQAAETGNVDDVVTVDGALLVEGSWNTFYQYRLSKNSFSK